MSDFAISDVLPGRLNALVKNLMAQMGITDPNEAVRRVNAGEWVVNMVKRLARVGEITLPARPDAFDPAAFYKTRESLYVWDGFRDRILPAARPVESLPAIKAISFDLAKPANDAEIRRELPEHHVFENAFAFSAYLAGMILRQPKGRAGALLANGYANIFYVRGVNAEVFAVSVRWNSDGGEWCVRAYPRLDRRWVAGYRVFSSNCLPAEASAQAG
ncbi:MAG: hypothetical protein AAB367_04210 [Patescibacteria group bacterium]